MSVLWDIRLTRTFIAVCTSYGHKIIQTSYFTAEEELVIGLKNVLRFNNRTDAEELTSVFTDIIGTGQKQ